MFSEHDIDEQLKAELSVAPSPDFEARVLRAIDGQPGRRSALLEGGRWRSMPSYAFLAAAAAVVLTTTLSVVMMRTAGDAPMRDTQRAGNDVQLPLLASENPEPARLRAPEDRARASARRLGSASRGTIERPAKTEPEIIVPLNQMETLRRLADAVEEGRVSLAEILEGPVEPPVEIVVAPLVVEPLLPSIDPAEKGSTPEIRRPQ